jgi:hypothetical protein
VNEDLLGAARDIALLILGGGLTIFGGYLADKRETTKTAIEATS